MDPGHSGADQPALAALGWGADLAAAFDALAPAGDDLAPARVIAVDRGSYLVAAAFGGDQRAVLAGRARWGADDDPAALPVVGDWVALTGARPEADIARIEAVLPRRSWFARLAPGGLAAEQVLAANLDVVWLVASLEVEPNLRRIERYLAMAWEGGAQPVVVLNKADLHPDVAGVAAAVAGIAPGVPVVAASAVTGAGMDELAAWLEPGRTLALFGSSGVGKSTLANRLLGDERQSTAATRDDGRGRHTTTRRQLLRLPGGALLIDTPGLRTVLMGLAGNGLERTFADIEALAHGPDGCRFGDCRHDREPGCQVLQAVADGRLDPERLAGWRKLERELAWLAARDDPTARAVRGRQWRAIHRSLRAVQRDKEP
jgi:ribosome biogenesis GTPase / thiamine phosphate phosphatase